MAQAVFKSNFAFFPTEKPYQSFGMWTTNPLNTYLIISALYFIIVHELLRCELIPSHHEA